MEISKKKRHYCKMQGLYCEQITKNKQVFLDPDNVFWGIVKNESESSGFISRELLSLYEKQKNSCDKEMYDFRFKTGLTAVYVDPTDRCNAQCPYCYLPTQTRKYGQSINQAQLDRLLTKVVAYFEKIKRTPVIIFHAAEPLIVKDILFNSIARFKDKLYFGIQTNALLLEKEDVKFIEDHKVSIGISIDAADAKTNNELRLSSGGGGNFDKAAQALEWFCGYNGLNVITTITKKNVKKLPALIDFLHSKGVRCVLMNPMRLTRKGARSLCPDVKEMTRYFIKAVDRSIEISKSAKQDIIIGNFTNIIIAIVAPTARRMMCDISPCGGGRTFLTVRANGDMIPCGEFVGVKGDFTGGNIFKNSIEKAMRSEAFEKIRGRYVEKIPECDVCLLRNICGAPCPAEMVSMGNLYKKSVFCEFYKEIIRYAFKLISEGKEKYLLRPNALKNLKYEYRL
ncbi:MAG: peptide-modifying radical SAM enzyme CbpB [Candidatus Orphnella occulta]|nr:peptide-modifying radical SAM enzyme CbpB [Candidatus Orphnella occulta]